MKYKTKTNMIIGSVVILLIVFYGGMKYGQSQSPASNFAYGGGSGQGGGSRAGRTNGMGGGRMGGQGGVIGQIVSVDDKSMTIEQRDGSSKIVFLAGSTSVTKSAPGTAKDLAAGQQVTVMGTANSDGSETAQFVQIRPNLTNSNQ